MDLGKLGLLKDVKDKLGWNSICPISKKWKGQTIKAIFRQKPDFLIWDYEKYILDFTAEVIDKLYENDFDGWADDSNQEVTNDRLDDSFKEVKDTNYDQDLGW